MLGKREKKLKKKIGGLFWGKRKKEKAR